MRKSGGGGGGRASIIFRGVRPTSSGGGAANNNNNNNPTNADTALAAEDNGERESSNHSRHNNAGNEFTAGEEADGPADELDAPEKRTAPGRTASASQQQPSKERPSYRIDEGGKKSQMSKVDVDEDDDDEEEEDRDRRPRGNPPRTLNQETTAADYGRDTAATPGTLQTAAIVKHIEKSAGTHRLNRILKQSAVTTSRTANNTKLAKFEKVADPLVLSQVADFCGRVVLPPFRIDPHSIGGAALMEQSQQQPNYYPDSIVQEALLVFRVAAFESSTTGSGVAVDSTILQFPSEYAKHKRSLVGLVGKAGGNRSSNKLRYIVIARSTNHPIIPPKKTVAPKSVAKNDTGDDESEHDYDTMFAADQDDAIFGTFGGRDDTSSFGSSAATPRRTVGGKTAVSKTASTHAESVFTSSFTEVPTQSPPTPPPPDDDKDNDKVAEESKNKETSEHHAPATTPLENGDKKSDTKLATTNAEEDEYSSFPVLVCLTLNSDGTAPDIRKMCGLINLTTVQDLHATVVQLAFNNGDTLRLDFSDSDIDRHHHHANSNKTSAAGNDTPPSGLNKDRFIWSLLQLHAMLCCSVVERQAYQLSALWLPPLNVRNLDRAELQYVATVNGFLKESLVMTALLERQRPYLENDDDDEDLAATKDKNKNTPTTPATSATSGQAESKVDMEDLDSLAYDLMMGNFHTRVTLFQSEEERKDAEEILNSTQWTRSLNKDESASAAVSVAERLATMLQGRMHDLEAETCRRLIAWEDEKHFSSTRSATTAFTAADERDTVDALALASLFKMLESLDTELADMEDWLQERAAAIKPLTDDCADIEEENRQLEQQWKSYDMLGSEMRRLLQGMDLEEETEKVLKNPALALAYDDAGRVNVIASDQGVTAIHEAGKKLQEALEFPMRSGGLHLEAVSERSKGLDSLSNRFCTALAHIIVTVMEQFNEEVLASSDYGKVSKNDSHSMIAKKIRDTQRRFQSSLLGYIKLIEILAALNPDMLPALRDAYSEMVAESILMKKRMKGYFQALPGKNSAYMNKTGKDIKDYTPFKKGSQPYELVNAPDIKNSLAELFPIIAREAYFTSALFGSTSKDQDGREKKRHFEGTRLAVDNASQNFRYYIERTCGILPDTIGGKTTIENGVKGDPMLCLVGSLYLNEAMENYIDREKKGGDHSLSLAYVRATILDLRKKADKQWVGWVDKQIEWIRTHDGVPLSGKRAGIFSSFSRFPCYLDHVLMAASEGREETYIPGLVHIKVINYYMQKLASTLLESLKECAARETTDQSYAANVMQMENTYFFTQAIKQRGPVVSDLFAKQIVKANVICKESTDSYLGWMIKREFVTLHELFSRVSKLRKDVGDREVPTHVSKVLFVRTLQKEASREVMKEKISLMFGRMEKHLSEDGGLLPVAWKALVKVLYEWFGRWEKMSTQIYGHRLSPSAVDIVRIAKAAGGAPVKKPSVASGGNGAGISGAGSNDFGFKTILALGNKTNPPSVSTNPSI